MIPYWLKEKGTQYYCPYDNENNLPVYGVGQLGAPKAGEIIGEFKLFQNHFEIRIYEHSKYYEARQRGEVK